MTIYSLNHLRNTFLRTKHVMNRPFFYWVLDVFNSVDKKYIEEVGPDRACAEWLLKNGAAVRWKDCTNYCTDYNSFIQDNSRLFIEGVDATDSGIYYLGFRYFENCKYLNEIILNQCEYVDDRALKLLSVVKDTLTDLEIQRNVNVTPRGLRELKVLEKLEKLTLAEIKRVKDKDSIRDELARALPNCRVEYF